jgi:hypothetical protein
MFGNVSKFKHLGKTLSKKNRKDVDYEISTGINCGNI